MEREAWQAHLTLELAARHGKTALTRNQHQGPLLVQRPFYPQGEEGCHLYILHPPGGVVAGDQLRLQATLHPGAKALITTPAAGKIYRSDGERSLVEQSLTVQAGAFLEWMPLETIVYDQARAHLLTVVELADNASFLGWEILCLGLPASAQPYRAGLVRQDLEVWQQGRPLLIERSRYQGGSQAMEAYWGLGGRVVSGTLVASQGSSELLEAVRAGIRDLSAPGQFAATLVSGLMVCRYLGWEAEAARGIFMRVWEIVRPLLMGRAACPPRIWRL